MQYRHLGAHDCGRGDQDRLEMVGTGCSPWDPEPLALQQEGPGQVLVAVRGSYRLMDELIFSAGHLKLPVGVEGPSHCHPLGQGLVLQGPFCCCSISEMGGYPSWRRR